MNILLSVFECNPLRGSDSYVGWSYATNISHLHTVYALTRSENRADIEAFCKKEKIDFPNLHFIYVDQSKLFSKILYKINRYLGFLGSYFVWQKAAYQTTKKLCKTVRIVVCHHVSIADFRCSGYLWKLDIPFIFGPVGGQETPLCFKDYIKGHEKAELFRSKMNKFTTMLPSYRKALKISKVIFSSNDETTDYILKRFKNSPDIKSKVFHLSELCINDEYLHDRFDLYKNQRDIVHIIVSGRLIYRKGIQVLLDSLPLINSKTDYIVDIYGEGDQKSFLESYSQELGLAHKVVFHGKVAFEDMQENYKTGDIYVLPSLRESTGTAVLEAMANKLPVITFNQNGAKYIVENDAGILVNLSTKDKVLRDLADALEKLIDNYSLRIKLGQSGFEKVQTKYTWSNRARSMSELYKHCGRADK